MKLFCDILFCSDELDVIVWCSRQSRELLRWFSDTMAPDEYIWPTLNHNPQLHAPGSYKGQWDPPVALSTARNTKYKQWRPFNYVSVKGKGAYSSLWIGNPSQSYGASPAIWDHTVLPATRHRWMRPTLTSAMQAGTRFTYLGRMEGWVDLGVGYIPRWFTCPQTVTG